MHAPISFWDAAILTSCYLINWMRSSVGIGPIPHILVFPSEPLYPIPPRIFGSTCFIFSHLVMINCPLGPLSCVFSSYSHLQKGYKCFPPDLDQYFISSEVTFFESTPLVMML